MTEHDRILNRMDRYSVAWAINQIVLCLLIGFIGLLVLWRIEACDNRLKAVQTKMSAEEKK